MLDLAKVTFTIEKNFHVQSNTEEITGKDFLCCKVGLAEQTDNSENTWVYKIIGMEDTNDKGIKSHHKKSFHYKQGEELESCDRWQ
jgi:hypothetical protein